MPVVPGVLWARCAGSIHLDSISEKLKHKITTQPTASGKGENAPSVNSVGEKAIMVVSTPKVAGVATRSAPVITESMEWPLFSASA